MYCREEMVEILKCYLIPKKVMALCLRVQFFLANPVPLRGDNTKFLYNRQYKITTLIKQCEFIVN